MSLCKYYNNFPIAERIPHNTMFGKVADDRGEDTMDPPISMEDNYHWIRDDTRTNKEVIQHLKKENKFTEKIMKNTKELQQTLYDEIMTYIEEDYDSYPLPNSDNTFNSDFLYFTRTLKGKSYPIHCRINMKTSDIIELLDENIIAEGKTSCDISNFKVSKNHKYMSYGIDLTGNEKYKIIIEDTFDKSNLEHKIPEIAYCDYSWYDDTIYYTVGDEQNRMYQLWRYNIKNMTNELIYQNDNPLANIGYHFSNDMKYIFISANTYESSDVYYFRHNDITIKQFTPMIKNHKYTVDYHHGNFVIKTNKDGCVNYKVMVTPEDDTSIDNWKLLIRYDEKEFIKNIYELNNYLVISYKARGTSSIRVIPYVGYYDIMKGVNVEIGDGITNIDMYYVNYYSDNILFSTNSLDTPFTIYRYNLESNNRFHLRSYPVPNYDSELFETKRIYAPSHDGTMIPMSIVYKKELFKQDGSNKLYLYGYGSYGIIVEPKFNKNIIPLLNRGFVYVIAHVRGGSFLGEKWYEEGKMENKINTFLDFNACAEYLIKEKYTFDKGITIEGRSAGGLLVGACMTMKPELYRTVIAGVPFVDVMNTMSDPSIPLTVPEWEQWGNPNIKKYFDIMLKYSPYDNIKETEYPNVLALAGLNDPRVAYWEPAKFIAKLRHYNKGKNIMLLKTEMEQGHFGGMDRYKHIKETAFMYSFILSTYD